MQGQLKVSDLFNGFNVIGGQPPIPIVLNSGLNYLTEPITVDLMNDETKVALDGYFRFNFGGSNFVQTDLMLVTIYIYGGSKNSPWIYYNLQEISGLTLTPNENLNFSIPIKYFGKAVKSVTDKAAKYYIGIDVQTSITPIATTIFELQQYFVEAREI